MTHTADSFWKKVARSGANECWPWIGKSRAADGYGRIDIWGEEGVYAPRVAYLINHPGSISLKAPKDKSVKQFVRHTCDNPACCNPAHLILGNYAENSRDCVERGRSNKYKSTESPRAKLSEDDVREIRRLKKYATVKALALLFDVSISTISFCLYGRSYQDIR